MARNDRPPKFHCKNGFIFPTKKMVIYEESTAKPGGIPAATSIFGEDHGQSSGLQGLRVRRTHLRDHFLGIQKFMIFYVCVYDTVCIYIYIYIHTYIDICIYLYCFLIFYNAYVCIYIYIYIYLHLELTLIVGSAGLLDLDVIAGWA